MNDFNYEWKYVPRNRLFSKWRCLIDVFRWKEEDVWFISWIKLGGDCYLAAAMLHTNETLGKKWTYFILERTRGKALAFFMRNEINFY